MAYRLFRPTGTAKTLASAAVAVLSLGTMGPADAQGLAAGVQAPAYGTTWAAKHRSKGSGFSSTGAKRLQDDRAGGTTSNLDGVYASSGRTSSD
jgi:hypothetical protein